ncbi:MAG: nuclease [Meiothermus sp.]|nr:MAG: nuclease [Meiothermus sp.]
MAWKLEAWNPEYALPERIESEDESGGLEDIKIPYEGDWVAHTPPRVAPQDWPIVYLVDGRRRIDAQIADARGRRALLATVIAGAVLRDGAGIRPVGDPIKRHILLHSSDLVEPLPPGLRHYEPIQTEKSDPTSLRSKVIEVMRHLEASLVNRLEGGLVIVDGQIFPGEQAYHAPERLLGYTKTQAATYLGPKHQALLYELQPYQRTPIFQIPRQALPRQMSVSSWYVRLPLEPNSTFYSGAALLRIETPTEEPSEAVRLADLSVSLFCTLASSPAKDPRAPQNLIPIGGLEQWLGRHLGQAEVVRRRIVQALFA